MEVLGNVLGGVKELYDKTNKANLSGAIDVVVVKQVIAHTRYHKKLLSPCWHCIPSFVYASVTGVYF